MAPHLAPCFKIQGRRFAKGKMQPMGRPWRTHTCRASSGACLPPPVYSGATLASPPRAYPHGPPMSVGRGPVANNLHPHSGFQGKEGRKHRRRTQAQAHTLQIEKKISAPLSISGLHCPAPSWSSNLSTLANKISGAQPADGLPVLARARRGLSVNNRRWTLDRAAAKLPASTTAWPVVHGGGARRWFVAAGR